MLRTLWSGAELYDTNGMKNCGMTEDAPWQARMRPTPSRCSGRVLWQARRTKKRCNWSISVSFVKPVAKRNDKYKPRHIAYLGQCRHHAGGKIAYREILSHAAQQRLVIIAVGNGKPGSDCHQRQQRRRNALVLLNSYFIFCLLSI